MPRAQLLIGKRELDGGIKFPGCYVAGWRVHSRRERKCCPVAVDIYVYRKFVRRGNLGQMVARHDLQSHTAGAALSVGKLGDITSSASPLNSAITCVVDAGQPESVSSKSCHSLVSPTLS